MLDDGKTVSETKTRGRIFTPNYLVCNMLDLISYEKGITQKHILDNSCGDGAYLCEIANRYCKDFLRKSGDLDRLKKELATYIHGIDIDLQVARECVKSLEESVSKYNICGVDWNILCADAMSYRGFDGKMDYVVANPPYVRVHNLNESTKAVREFEFAKLGMTDLYIVFFEIGFRQLAKTGKMCYISPSSYFRNVAGKGLRAYIAKEKNLATVYDLAHFMPFDAMTYTAIVLFENGKVHKKVNYYSYDEKTKAPIFREKLSLNDVFIKGKMYFSAGEDLKWLGNILKTTAKNKARVKNGFATLADSVFVSDFPFKEFTIGVVKASKGSMHRCFFPYDKNNKLLPYEKLIKNPKVKEYLEEHKKQLTERSIRHENDWYGFGRTQALGDVWRDKIAISSIVKDVDSIKLREVPVGNGVYGGLYICTEVPYAELETVVKSEQFIKYLSLLKNYKSGGYYSFSGRELELYLNYVMN